MEVSFESVGVLLLLVLFAVDKGMGFLKSRGVDLQKMARQLDEATSRGSALPKMAQQIDRLDEIITRTDEDGAPIVYVRRALQTAIEDLSKSIQSQTRLLEAMVGEVKRLRDGTVQGQAALGELLKRPCMQQQAEAGGA